MQNKRNHLSDWLDITEYKFPKVSLVYLLPLRIASRLERGLKRWHIGIFGSISTEILQNQITLSFVFKIVITNTYKKKIESISNSESMISEYNYTM